SWEELVGLDHVVISDGGGSFSLTVPIHPTIPIEEALDHVTEVKGGINGPRIYEGGDVGLIYATLADEAGRVMPPEPEMVTFEVEGAELVDPPSLLFGAYYVFGSLLTHPEPGEGEVRIILADGRKIGTYPFTRLPRLGSGISAEHSWGTLAETAAGEDGATHELRLNARNRFHEAVGYAARVKLEVTGGEVITPLTLDMKAVFVGTVKLSPYAEEMTVNAYVDDILVESVTVENPDPQEPPPPEEDVTEPSGEDVAQVEDTGPTLPDEEAIEAPEVEPPPPAANPSKGCGSGPDPPLWVAGLLLLILSIYRHKMR
ncbi:MAG: hypothetical protein VX938_10460, partial [Myxococcota bacterium]|nr:hypothetical protein [Myxococcota bacterium]